MGSGDKRGAEAGLCTAAGFHKYVTVGRVAAFCLALSALAMAITLPVIFADAEAQTRSHKDDATARAEEIAAALDREIGRMNGALKRLIGFVLSAAPLNAPTDYFTQNASDRLAAAMRSGSAGAMSYSAYLRIRTEVQRKVRGYRNVVIHPGLVNAFVDPSSSIAGRDWLFWSPSIHQEWVYMVNHSTQLLRPASRSVTNASVIIVITRVPIFTNTSALDPNPAAVDPATGRHPNWRHLWGGISVVKDMGKTAGLLTDAGGAFAGLANEYDWMLDSGASVAVDSGVVYPRLIIKNTTDPAEFESDPSHVVRACSSLREFRKLCFCFMPLDRQWRGEDTTSAVVLGVVLCLVVPAGIVLAILAIARACAGPEPDPLRFAPVADSTVHAACIDLADANRLWGEVPFVMHEVTTLFTAEVARQAQTHGVFIALQHGATAIGVANTREAVAAFARGMAEWGLGAPWPPHITVHCPRGTLELSGVLHTCDDVDVRVDEAAGTCDVTGVDIAMLLLMRVAAIPQHVICTGEFLDVVSLSNAANRSGAGGIAGLGVSGDSLASRQTKKILAMLGPCAELGVCELPLPTEASPVTPYRGYLVTSPATGERDLNDVIDSLPDSVWAEWRSAQMLADAGQLDPNQVRNPLDGSAAGGPWGRSASTGGALGSIAGFGSVVGFGGSKTASIAGARRAVTRAHLNNGSADARLPATAGDAADTKKVATELVTTLGRVHGLDADADAQDADGATPAAKDRRLRAAVSLCTYYLTVYRLMFAPLEHDVRTAMVSRICAAVGVSADEYAVGLAVRCMRQSMRFVERDTAQSAEDGLAEGDGDALRSPTARVILPKQ